jgi:acyl carrier protein
MEEDEAEVTVALETRFQDDLELESIELIALGDLLLERYGDSLNFAGWLTQLSLDELAELKVGDLVSWLHRELSERR